MVVCNLLWGGVSDSDEAAVFKYTHHLNYKIVLVFCYRILIHCL